MIKSLKYTHHFWGEYQEIFLCPKTYLQRSVKLQNEFKEIVKDKTELKKKKRKHSRYQNKP